MAHRYRTGAAAAPHDFSSARCDRQTPGIWLHRKAPSSTIWFVKTFNLMSAVLVATMLATSAVQLTLPDGDSAAGWRIGVAWMLGALVWAVVYSLVRDGVRGTLSVLKMRGRHATRPAHSAREGDDAVVRLP